MPPSVEVQRLDSALQRAGGDIVLRRTVGTGSSKQVIDVIIRAHVRSPMPDEVLTSGLTQSDWMVIMSPSEIMKDQWPGGHNPTDLHASLPRGGTNGDQLVIFGKQRQILNVNAIVVQNELVRIELRVQG